MYVDAPQICSFHAGKAILADHIIESGISRHGGKGPERRSSRHKARIFLQTSIQGHTAYNTPCRPPRRGPGKSSNISWVAKEVQRKYTHSQSWRDVLLTVMDSKFEIGH